VSVYVLRSGAGGADTPRAPIYRFRGAKASCEWPRANGTRLGACGIWNFLWRLGYHPRDIDSASLPASCAGHVLFAQLEPGASDTNVAAARQWMDRGGHVVLSGDPVSCGAVERVGQWEFSLPENPYAGLAYVVAGGPSLVAPAGWSFGRSGAPTTGVRHVGQLALVGGERQTPSRALVSVIPDAPAVAISADGLCCYLNGNPFAGFQAWLQGQEDLQPWLAWRHRLFWLDEWVSDLAGVLQQAGVPAFGQRPGIAGLGATTVVLRHDVDFSRDTSYYDEATARGVPTTYAVLDDGNRAFWLKHLARQPQHEAAFHYTTGGRDWIGTARRRMSGQSGGTMKPDFTATTGGGLLRQVRRAKDRGIGIATLHRHMLFMRYPEWVDGLDEVFDHEAAVLGGSSLFRAQVVRWGGTASDGVSASTGEWPDAQFPLWLPFKVCHAADGGRRLRGWESTSIMEPEPGFVAQLLDYRVPHVPQRVITIGFHPAHATRPTFAAGGSIGAFKEVLSLLAERRIDVRTLRDVYSLAHDSSA
jgi:hypothetical protein